MSLIASDCSIPISSVAHVVVFPQRALLSEKEQMNGWKGGVRLLQSCHTDHKLRSKIKGLYIFFWALTFLQTLAVAILNILEHFC